MKVSVIITAGGSGTRFSSIQKKQYYLLFGKPIIYWTITKFLKNKNISETIIVLPKNNFHKKKKSIQELFHKVNLKFCIGGKTRQDSVYNGLKECVDTDIVMIHDGVRPFIDNEVIDKLIHICKETGSAIPGSRIVHTIKKINENNITDTVDRNELVQVYTPQTFLYKEILQLHKKAREFGLTFTDDASLFEPYGYKTTYVETSIDNIKITNKSDLDFAKVLMHKYFEVDDD